jgi:hypothetical protein
MLSLWKNSTLNFAVNDGGVNKVQLLVFGKKICGGE